MSKIFLLQKVFKAKYFVETNIYIKTKNELAECLNNADKEILDICINKKQIDSISKNELESLYKKLIDWTSQNI